MKNLEEAIIEARKRAEGNDFYDSICLTVTSNGEFIIGERCSRNVRYSSYAVGRNQPHEFNIVVPFDCSFSDVTDWDLLVFCVKFGIKVSDYKFTYSTGEEI